MGTGSDWSHKARASRWRAISTQLPHGNSRPGAWKNLEFRREERREALVGVQVAEHPGCWQAVLGLRESASPQAQGRVGSQLVSPHMGEIAELWRTWRCTEAGDGMERRRLHG